MYTLGTYGQKTLICIGTTPNTAQPEHLDAVSKSVEGIAQYNGYDSWQMLHIYAKRDNFFDNQARRGEHKTHLENIATIRQTLEKYKDETEIPIWAAWGERIFNQDFLLPYLRDIYSLTREYPAVHWYCTGTSRHGIPKNPLYLSSNTRLVEVDMEQVMKLM